MNKRSLVRILSEDEQVIRLEEELSEAKAALQKAEASLSLEQAEVNAFRMHCRLRLGPWVDEIIELHIEKQRMLTRLSLTQQAAEMGQPFDEAEWLSQAQADDEEEERLIAELAESMDLPYDINTSDEKFARKLYRDLARKFHPDLAESALQKAYSTSMMAAINDAYARKDTQTLSDLAGAIDPKDVEDLNRSKSGDVRKIRTLQRRLRKCKQLHRRALIQLKALRNENTAKLWKKAQTIDKHSGQNWWDEVAATLKSQIDQFHADIAQLSRRLVE